MLAALHENCSQLQIKALEEYTRKSYQHCALLLKPLLNSSQQLCFRHWLEVWAKALFCYFVDRLINGHGKPGFLGEIQHVSIEVFQFGDGFAC